MGTSVEVNKRTQWQLAVRESGNQGEPRETGLCSLNERWPGQGLSNCASSGTSSETSRQAEGLHGCARENHQESLQCLSLSLLPLPPLFVCVRSFSL